MADHVEANPSGKPGKAPPRIIRTRTLTHSNSSSSSASFPLSATTTSSSNNNYPSVKILKRKAQIKPNDIKKAKQTKLEGGKEKERKKRTRRGSTSTSGDNSASYNNNKNKKSGGTLSHSYPIHSSSSSKSSSALVRRELRKRKVAERSSLDIISSSESDIDSAIIADHREESKSAVALASNLPQQTTRGGGENNLLGSSNKSSSSSSSSVKHISVIHTKRTRGGKIPIGSGNQIQTTQEKQSLEKSENSEDNTNISSRLRLTPGRAAAAAAQKAQLLESSLSSAPKSSSNSHQSSPTSRGKSKGKSFSFSRKKKHLSGGSHSTNSAADSDEVDNNNKSQQQPGTSQQQSTSSSPSVKVRYPYELRSKGHTFEGSSSSSGTKGGGGKKGSSSSSNNLRSAQILSNKEKSLKYKKSHSSSSSSSTFSSATSDTLSTSSSLTNLSRSSRRGPSTGPLVNSTTGSCSSRCARSGGPSGSEGPSGTTSGMNNSQTPNNNQQQSSSTGGGGRTESSSGSGEAGNSLSTASALSLSRGLAMLAGEEGDETEMGRLQALLEARGLPPHLFGSLPRMLHRGMSNSTVTKAQQLLQGLQAVGDEGQQLQAAIEMCQLLVMGNEDTLAGFPVKQTVPALISLLSMEHNFDMMNHACRALTYLMEALPRSTPVVAEAVPVFLEKLQIIQCMDVAEQSLTALEMLSRRHAKTILQARGIASCLTYLDFFSIVAQRAALAITANCCQTVHSDEFHFVSESLSFLASRLTQQDKKSVESVCLAFSRMVDSFASDPARLEEIASTELLANLQQLLVVTPPLVSTGTFILVLRMMAQLCSRCPSIAVKLLEQNIVATLSALLLGSSSVTTFDHSSDEIELVSRNPQELLEIVALIAELLPKLPKEGLFIVNSLMTHPHAVHNQYQDAIQWQWKDDRGLWNSYSAFDSRIIESAHQAGDDEVSLSMQGRTYTIDFLGMQQINEDSGTARTVQRKVNPFFTAKAGDSKDPSSKDIRSQYLSSHPDFALPFLRPLFALLSEANSSSAGPAVRHNCVKTILRIVHFLPSESLQKTLRPQQVSNNLASILGSSDLKIVVGAFQICSLLMEKLYDFFVIHFRREGVFHQISRISSSDVVGASPIKSECAILLNSSSHLSSSPSVTNSTPNTSINNSASSSSSTPATNNINSSSTSSSGGGDIKTITTAIASPPRPISSISITTASNPFQPIIPNNNPTIVNNFPPTRSAPTIIQPVSLPLPLPLPPSPFGLCVGGFGFMQGPPPPLQQGPGGEGINSTTAAVAAAAAAGNNNLSGLTLPYILESKTSSNNNTNVPSSGNNFNNNHISNNNSSSGIFIHHGKNIKCTRSAVGGGIDPLNHNNNNNSSGINNNGTTTTTVNTTTTSSKGNSNEKRSDEYAQAINDVFKRKRVSKRPIPTSTTTRRLRQDDPFLNNNQSSVGHLNNNESSKTGSSNQPAGQQSTTNTSSSKRSNERERKSFFASLNPSRWRGSPSSSSSNNNSPSTSGGGGGSGGYTALASCHLERNNGVTNARGGASQYIAISYKENVKTWLREHSVVFTQKYGRNAAGTENLSIETQGADGVGILTKLQEIIDNLKRNDKMIDALRELQSIVVDSDISSFEINHSGLIGALLGFLAEEVGYSSNRDNRLRSFIHVFADCPIDDLSGDDLDNVLMARNNAKPSALSTLVLKLNNCLSQVEQFQVKVHEVPTHSSGSRAAPSSALRFFNTHQLKCVLQRHSSCNTLRSWKGGPVKIDPLALVQAIERYLIVRGFGRVRESRGDSGDSEDDNSDDDIDDTLAGVITQGSTRHKLQFLIGDTILPYNMTVYQAIRQFGMSSGDHSSELETELDPASPFLGSTGIWAQTHTIYYRPMPEEGQNPTPTSTSKSFTKKSKSPSSKSASKSKKDPLWNDGIVEEPTPSYLSFLNSKLPDSVTFSDPSLPVVSLLRIIHAICRFWRTLYWPNLPGEPLITLTEFINTKVSAKAMRQLQDPVSIIAGNVPLWLQQLGTVCQFLFPFEIRQMLFYSITFDRDRALQRLLDTIPELNSSEREDRVTPRLDRRKRTISRDQILTQAEQLMNEQFISGSSKPLLEIQYENEVGTGLGPTLEFYALVSKELQKRELDLWHNESSVDEKSINQDDKDISKYKSYVHTSVGLFPKPVGKSGKSGQISKLKSKFKFLGRFMAKAVMDSRMIDLPISKSLYKWILGCEGSLNLSDMSEVDSTMARSIRQLVKVVAQKKRMERDTKLGLSGELNNALEALTLDGCRIDALGLDFTLPGYPTIELRKGGKDIPVTIHNLEEYIKLVCHWALYSGVSRQMEAWREGFDAVFTSSALKIFYPEELEMVFCGANQTANETWDVKTLLECCRPDHGYTTESRAIQFLFEIMASFSLKDRRNFIQFVTGSPRLPVGGFKALQPPLTIVRKTIDPPVDADNFLPSVMTCVNYLKLPDYSSIEIMRERLRMAAEEGQMSFHLS